VISCLPGNECNPHSARELRGALTYVQLVQPNGQMNAVRGGTVHHGFTGERHHWIVKVMVTECWRVLCAPETVTV
jgi:hypothetical protein